MRTREYIEKGETEGKSLIDAMEQGDQDGMQTFDSVIEQMVRNGVLTMEGALPYASNANNMLLRLSDLRTKPPGPPHESTSAKETPDSMLDMLDL
jgi:twitching motility protein PilT